MKFLPRWRISKLNDVVVIGAGPAGISASIYLKRAGLEPLVFERGEIGGLILNANLVENYPGFLGGIKGDALANLFKEQLAATKIDVTKTEVSNISIENDGFRIITGKGEYRSRCVILATGTIPTDAGIAGTERHVNQRIFYEVKDVPHPRKGRRFVIIGGGDAAFDYALNLSRDDCTVQILMRGHKSKCISLLEKRVKETQGIQIINDTTPKSVKEEEGKLVLECDSNGNETELPTDYILIACGRKPNLDVLPAEISNNVKTEQMDADIPGLFLAGDVKRGDFRQVGIAVGDGIIAAMSAVEFLRMEEVE